MKDQFAPLPPQVRIASPHPFPFRFIPSGLLKNVKSACKCTFLKVSLLDGCIIATVSPSSALQTVLDLNLTWDSRTLSFHPMPARIMPSATLRLYGVPSSLTDSDMRSFLQRQGFNSFVSVSGSPSKPTWVYLPSLEQAKQMLQLRFLTFKGKKLKVVKARNRTAPVYVETPSAPSPNLSTTAKIQVASSAPVQQQEKTVSLLIDIVGALSARLELPPINDQSEASLNKYLAQVSSLPIPVKAPSTDITETTTSLKVATRAVPRETTMLLSSPDPNRARLGHAIGDYHPRAPKVNGSGEKDKARGRGTPLSPPKSGITTTHNHFQPLVSKTVNESFSLVESPSRPATLIYNTLPSLLPKRGAAKVLAPPTKKNV